MDEKNEKILTDAFDSTPSEIQDFIMGDEYQASVAELGKEYSLTIDESRVIQIHTLYVLLGLELEEDGIDEIIVELRARSKEEIETIVNEIKENILIYK